MWSHDIGRVGKCSRLLHIPSFERPHCIRGRLSLTSAMLARRSSTSERRSACLLPALAIGCREQWSSTSSSSLLSALSCPVLVLAPSASFAQLTDHTLFRASDHKGCGQRPLHFGRRGESHFFATSGATQALVDHRMSRGASERVLRGTDDAPCVGVLGDLAESRQRAFGGARPPDGMPRHDRARQRREAVSAVKTRSSVCTTRWRDLQSSRRQLDSPRELTELYKILGVPRHSVNAAL